MRTCALTGSRGQSVEVRHGHWKLPVTLTKPSKSEGLPVEAGSFAASAVATMSRSPALPRDLRPAEITSAWIRPYPRAAPTSKAMGSKAASSGSVTAAIASSLGS